MERTTSKAMINGMINSICYLKYARVFARSM